MSLSFLCLLSTKQAPEAPLASFTLLPHMMMKQSDLKAVSA